MRDILIAIGLGILLGWIDIFSYKTKARLNKFSSGCLLLMLACLGAKIGCDRELLLNMDRLGLQSLGLAVSVVTGSIIMIYLISKIFAREVAEACQESSASQTDATGEVVRTEQTATDARSKEEHHD